LRPAAVGEITVLRNDAEKPRRGIDLESERYGRSRLHHSLLPANQRGGERRVRAQRHIIELGVLKLGLVAQRKHTQENRRGPAAAVWIDIGRHDDAHLDIQRLRRGWRRGRRVRAA